MTERNVTTNATAPAKATKKKHNSGGDLKILHRLIRGVSGMAARSFFTEIRVVGGEKVPKTGPIIVYAFSGLISYGVGAYSGCRTATHHNMMLDPVILCMHLPLMLQ
jgi:glycerol-3-phosphate O-acyltransferase / dihydroxyacetone phosphate acyltransferase